MSLHDALAIVARFGPATILIDRAAEPALARELALLGCAVGDEAAARAGVIRWHGQGGLFRAPGHLDRLAVLSEPGERRAVEEGLFADGWRRHPAGMMASEIAAWRADDLPRISYYRRARGEAADTLLGGGGASDGAIAWLASAAAIVRSGDDVLVGGLHAPAGAAIVAALSPARSVAALDGPLVDALADRADGTAGAIVLMLPGATAATGDLLDAAAAAMRADGRLLIGWPIDNVPSAEVRAAIEDRFITEQWRLVATEGGEPWLLVVASASSLDADPAVPYRHPAFAVDAAVPPVVADFAAAYDNPWLYRAMVQLGERIGDDVKLARLAECVLETAAPASADRGAALTVLGYRVLDARLDGAVPGLMAALGDYLAATGGANAPHVVRWRLSLLFLAGRLAEMTGDRAAAIAWFHAASLADWAGFSPILATKAIAAASHEARLRLAAGEKAAALGCFRRGLDTALAAAAAPHAALIGDPPLPFYLQEMAEVMDMGGQCAVALANAHLLDRDPGLFWRQVDMKRFGLFAWADALERDRAAAR